MSHFAATVVPVVLTKHENADSLSIAHVLGWQVVVRSDGWTGKDRGVYVPIDSVIPDALLEEWGMVGLLSGAKKNRVTTRKFRGAISQGLLMPCDQSLPIGTDLTESLGITKYEPPLPFVMQGKAKPWPSGLHKYDIERYENFPDVLAVGEEVVATCKLDGTNAAYDLRRLNGEWAFTACSRNIGFDADAPENDGNLYCQMARELGIEAKLRAFVEGDERPPESALQSVTLRGEIVGGRVQDNIYGLPKTTFRAFDIEINDRPLDYPDFLALTPTLGVDTVPELYRGPFPADHRPISYGNSLLGPSVHRREGAVWKPLAERHDPQIGRAQVKCVDPEYLLKQKD